ncbi:MAG: family 20 glycosylhydrolase [Clostridia bacterium]|nr:family 20 glycosylhydrolase [Clostridia bacterium]
MENIYYFKKQIQAKANSCLNKTVFKEFWDGFTCHSSNISVENIECYQFVIGEPEIVKINKELYYIQVDANGVAVYANDEKGLICGYMDLLQRIKVISTDEGQELFGIEYCSKAFSPLIRNRMVHFCVFPDTKLYEIQKFIRLCGALRYTHIVIEFWGMLKFDALKELAWPHAFTKDEIKPLIDEANDMGIEIIPMFNHWGHASASRVVHGKHVVLDQNLKLQPLFSDDGWTWRIETDAVRNLMRQIRNELMELCGDGEYFHLGCDESYNFDLNLETAHIVTEFLNEISDELKMDGRRAIVWGDMFIAEKPEFNKDNCYIMSCPDEAVQKEILLNLDKNIVIADWQYNVKTAPVETAIVFKEAGFDVMLCPWDIVYGDDSLVPCAKTVSDYSLFGLLHTTWHTLSSGMPDVTRAADLCWTSNENIPVYAEIRTKTANLIRKTSNLHGDYERSGWAPYEIGNKTF